MNLRTLIDFIWQFLFGCHHPHDARSRVWTDKEGEYQRCLDCGKRLVPRISFREQEA